MTFLCTYLYNGMPLQEIIEAESSIDAVLSLAEDGATAIRVERME